MSKLMRAASAGTLAFSLLVGAPAIAEDTAIYPKIIVNGEATVSAVPDIAVVTLGNLAQAPTAREALDKNNEAMAAIIKKLKDSGIENRDLQTSGFSINPQYDYSNQNGEPPKLIGYQAVNSLTVRVRDMKKLGQLLDNAVSDGVNSGGSISFINSNQDELMSEARKAAVKDAMKKADEMAEAAGVKRGAIITISQNQAYPAPQPMMAMASAAPKREADVPVEAGENTYRATATITFELQQ